MAMKITDECISCGACEATCPVHAISEGSATFVIDPQKCVECKGHAPAPQCADGCPSGAIVKA